MKYWILKGHEPVAVDDILEWIRWFKTADRLIDASLVGESRISTVFLGIDHSFGVGRQILFETTVFGGNLDQEMDRYCTWDEAKEGHAKMVARVMKDSGFSDEKDHEAH